MDKKLEAQEGIERMKEEIGGIPDRDQEFINIAVEEFMKGLLTSGGDTLSKEVIEETEEAIRAGLEISYIGGFKEGESRRKNDTTIKVPECPKCGWVFK